MTFDELQKNAVLTAVLAFNATTDGSAERAEILAQRARGNVQNLLDHHPVGWLKRRRIWSAVEAEIAANIKAIVEDATF